MDVFATWVDPTLTRCSLCLGGSGGGGAVGVVASPPSILVLVEVEDSSPCEDTREALDPGSEEEGPWWVWLG